MHPYAIFTFLQTDSIIDFQAFSISDVYKNKRRNQNSQCKPNKVRDG